MKTDFIKESLHHQAQKLKNELGVSVSSAYQIMAGINGYSCLHEQQEAIKNNRDVFTLLGISIHPKSTCRQVTGWKHIFDRQMGRVCRHFGWNVCAAKDFVARMHGFNDWETAELTLDAYKIVEGGVIKPLQERRNISILEEYTTECDLFCCYLADYYIHRARRMDDHSIIDFVVEMHFDPKIDPYPDTISYTNILVEGYLYEYDVDWQIAACNLVEINAKNDIQDSWPSFNDLDINKLHLEWAETRWLPLPDRVQPQPHKLAGRQCGSP